jgi:prevent-host-death family protein
MTRKLIGATAFKAQCLSIIDDVARSRQVVTITKRGKPVAELRPVPAKPKSIIGAMAGSVLYEGDMISPLDVEWDAMK